MMRLILSLTLTAMILGHSLAGAAVNADPKQVLQLVDQYLELQKENTPTKDAKAKVFKPIGKSAYLAQIVTTQLLSLEPEDFNLFLFYFVERFVNKPYERKVLFEFMNNVRAMIKPELDANLRLREGPMAFALQGSYTYGTYLFLGAGAFVLWRKVMMSPARTAAFLAQMTERETALMKMPKAYRYGSKIVRNPLMWTAVLGAGAGYLEYVLKSSYAQRLDPIEILTVVQANLACQLSFDALKLNQRFTKMAKDEDLMKDGAVDLMADISIMTEHAKVLAEQWPRLLNLKVDDRLFHNTLSTFPKAQNWQEYKGMLNDSAQVKEGQCRQIAIERLAEKLDEMGESLKTLSEINSPPSTLEDSPL